MHTYICWNILISQITEGKSPFFFLSMATSPVSILNIARQMEEAALFSLSRSIKYRKDGGNIGSQRSSKASPVQFPSISRFTLLLSPPPPPPSGVKYRFWYFHRYSFFHLPPVSLSLFFIKWRTGCETRNFSPPSPSQRGAQFALEKT